MAVKPGQWIIIVMPIVSMRDLDSLEGELLILRS